MEKITGFLHLNAKVDHSKHIAAGEHSGKLAELKKKEDDDTRREISDTLNRTEIAETNLLINPKILDQKSASLTADSPVEGLEDILDQKKAPGDAIHGAAYEAMGHAALLQTPDALQVVDRGNGIALLEDDGGQVSLNPTDNPLDTSSMTPLDAQTTAEFQKMEKQKLQDRIEQLIPREKGFLGGIKQAWTLATTSVDGSKEKHLDLKHLLREQTRLQSPDLKGYLTQDGKVILSELNAVPSVVRPGRREEVAPVVEEMVAHGTPEDKSRMTQALTDMGEGTISLLNRNGTRYFVVGPGEKTTSFISDEMKGKIASGDLDRMDKIEKVGGFVLPDNSVYLCKKEADYKDIGIGLITHETGHAFEQSCVKEGLITKEQVRSLYDAAKAEKRFVSAYASRDESEYFAESFRAYFEKGSTENVATRADLRRKDPKMFELLESTLKKLQAGGEK